MPLIDVGTILGRAAWVRHKAGLNDLDPPYSTRHVLETLFPGIAVTGSDDLPRGVTEMALASEGNRVILYSRRATHSLQRVAILHGLHHHIADLKWDFGNRECNQARRQLELDRGEIDPIELACDHFAGEVLVPFHVLDRFAPPPPPDAASTAKYEDEVDHLASRFNVPRSFMRWRLHDLQLLRDGNLQAKRR